MAKYLQKVWDIFSFDKFEILQISRSENIQTDLLSKLAISECADLKWTTDLEEFNKSTIEEPTH